MAAPKALNSPGSAGRPANVESPVPQNQDIPDISAGDVPDISAGDVSERQITLPTLFSSPKEIEQFAKSGPTVSEVADAASREFRGIGAEMAGGTTAVSGGAIAGGAVGGLGGLFLFGPAGVVPGIEGGAAVGGFVSGALATKDLVNYFRKAMSLPEEADRNQMLDIAASAVGTVVPIKGILGAAVRSEADIAKTLAHLPLEDRKIISALQQSVYESAATLSNEKMAIELRDAALKDIGDSLASGMNARQAVSFMAKKYGDKLKYAERFEAIANRFGEPMTTGELVAASGRPSERAIVGARPGDVIQDFNKRYNQEWAKSRALIANNRDLIERINLDPYVQDLKTLAESGAFTEEYRNKLYRIVNAIENNRSVENVVRSKTATLEELNKLVIVDAETGKQVSVSQLLNNNEKFIVPQIQEGMKISGVGPKPQLGGGVEITREKMPIEFVSLPEGQPGFQFPVSMRGKFTATEDTRRVVPGVSTPTEFTPAVTRQRTRLTGQPEVFAEAVGPQPAIDIPSGRFAGEHEQMALALNQKMEQQKLATLDTIINMRMSLDQAMSDYNKFAPKERAVLDAVTRLRSIEDSAIDAMISSPEQILQNVGVGAKSSKFALANHLAEEELLGKVTRKDAIGYASILDSYDPERIGAAARVLSKYPDSLNKIASSYLNEKLSAITSGSIVNLKQDAADKLFELGSGKSEASKKFLANIEILTGDKAVGKDLLELSTLLKRAARIPNMATRSRIEGQAVLNLSSKLTRFQLANPMTYINLLGPNNPQYAQKIVTQLFKNNREAFLNSVVTTPESVLHTVVGLEDLFGRAALPMTSVIIDRATRQGVISGSTLSAIRSQMSPDQAPAQ